MQLSELKLPLNHTNELSKTSTPQEVTIGRQLPGIVEAEVGIELLHSDDMTNGKDVSDEEQAERSHMQKILKEQYENLERMNEHIYNKRPHGQNVRDKSSQFSMRHYKRKSNSEKSESFHRNQTWTKQQTSRGRENAKKTIKPATGLPRSWLAPISNKDSAIVDCDVYSLPDGTLAVLKRNLKSSCRPMKIRLAERYGEASALSLDEEFLCPLCHDVFQNAILTPCCGETYCRECLLQLQEEEKDLICPGCSCVIKDLCDLVTNQTLQDTIGVLLSDSHDPSLKNLSIGVTKRISSGSIHRNEMMRHIKPLGQRLTNVSSTPS